MKLNHKEKCLSWIEIHSNSCFINSWHNLKSQEMNSGVSIILFCQRLFFLCSKLHFDFWIYFGRKRIFTLTFQIFNALALIIFLPNYLFRESCQNWILRYVVIFCTNYVLVQIIQTVWAVSMYLCKIQKYTSIYYIFHDTIYYYI